MYQRTGTYACTYGTHDFESVPCFLQQNHYNRKSESKKHEHREKGPKIAPKRNSYCVFPNAICFIDRPPVRRLQGLPQANFNPKTYRFFIFHERRAIMPKMSQKRKKELSLFLNDAGRVEYNVLCRRCVHECKQPHKAMVVECRRYLSKRSVEVMNHA